MTYFWFFCFLEQHCRVSIFYVPLALNFLLIYVIFLLCEKMVNSMVSECKIAGLLMSSDVVWSHYKQGYLILESEPWGFYSKQNNFDMWNYNKNLRGGSQIDSKFIFQSLASLLWSVRMPLWRKSHLFYRSHFIYHHFRWYTTFENKTPEEMFPKFSSIIHIIDRSDRNPPITAASMT